MFSTVSMDSFYHDKIEIPIDYSLKSTIILSI